MFALQITTNIEFGVAGLIHGRQQTLSYGCNIERPTLLLVGLPCV